MVTDRVKASSEVNVIVPTKPTAKSIVPPLAVVVIASRSVPAPESFKEVTVEGVYRSSSASTLS